MNNLAAFPGLSTRPVLLGVLATLIGIALLAIVLVLLNSDIQIHLVGPMRWTPDAARLA